MSMSENMNILEFTLRAGTERRPDHSLGAETTRRNYWEENLAGRELNSETNWKWT